MTSSDSHNGSKKQRRRSILRESLKLIVIAMAVFAAYFVVPLELLTRFPFGLTLTVGLVVLGAVSIWQVRSVIDSDHPTVRGIEALVGVIPLFLSLFAAGYYVMDKVQPDTFNNHLTRADALYFTVTVFSTVGFGDLVATSENARLYVTFQMILDLLIVGLGVRVLTRAVQIGMARHGQDDSQD